MFENHQGVAHSKVFDSLFARERLGSTGLGQGVAIPHGRIKGLKESIAAFVRVESPIQFDAPDGQPVSLMIFLLVPEQASQQHLDILSELTQMLSDKPFREEPAVGDRPARGSRRIDHLGTDSSRRVVIPHLPAEFCYILSRHAEFPVAVRNQSRSRCSSSGWPAARPLTSR